jgi:hypothetical protein
LGSCGGKILTRKENLRFGVRTVTTTVVLCWRDYQQHFFFGIRFFLSCTFPEVNVDVFFPFASIW